MNIRVLGEAITASTDSSTEFSVSDTFDHMDEKGKTECDSIHEVVFMSCDGHEMTVPATYTLPEAMLRGPRVLKESAAVLHILFDFMGPGKHPALEDEPFHIQLAVAEAAEKYSVFSAMNFCRYMLSQTLPLHSLDILAFATRHQYDGLINKAAPLVLQMRLLDVLEALPNDWTLPWVRYATKWQELLMEKTRIMDKVPRAQDASLKRACYLDPRCAGSLLPLLTQLKSLSAFERGKVETKVVPCLERWCICGSLLEELLDPTRCLGPFSAFAPPSRVSEGRDTVSSGIIDKPPSEPVFDSAPVSVPVKRVDSDDVVTVWLEGVTKKVKAEDDALEAERVRRLEEVEKVEQDASGVVQAYLEHEGVTTQDKTSHCLTEEETRQMRAKEEHDRLRAAAEEEERRRLEEKEEKRKLRVKEQEERFRAEEEKELRRLEEELRKMEEEELAKAAFKKAQRKVLVVEEPPLEHAVKPKKKKKALESDGTTDTKKKRATGNAAG